MTLGCCFPPASPAPAPQDLLPPDSLCPGKIERADLVGQPPSPSPPRRVVLRGHCRGHAGRRVMLLSAQEPPDGFLAGQKGRQQYLAQPRACLLLSQRWRLKIEGEILFTGRISRVNSGALGCGSSSGNWQNAWAWKHQLGS